MANTKSAIKRIRIIARQTTVNRARKSKFKNAIKKMNLLIDSKKKHEALKFLPKLNSELMRVAKTGLVKRKNASRNWMRGSDGRESGNWQSLVFCTMESLEQR